MKLELELLRDGLIGTAAIIWMAMTLAALGLVAVLAFSAFGWAVVAAALLYPIIHVGWALIEKYSV